MSAYVHTSEACALVNNTSSRINNVKLFKYRGMAARHVDIVIGNFWFQKKEAVCSLCDKEEEKVSKYGEFWICCVCFSRRTLAVTSSHN